MTRDEIIDATRTFLRAEILHDDVAALASDEPLLSGGIITSFDLVSLTVFLEQRFGVRVPDSKVSRDFLDSLDQIAGLVLSLGGSESLISEGPAPDPFSRWALPSFQNRPLLVIVGVVLILIALDRLAGWFVERPAFLERVDPKRMNYCFLSYERALARHELGLTPKGRDEIRIAFQGDSGTFGTYLKAEEACPAVAGRRLAERDPRVRVYNVSYFGQTFVKDAEMLEAELPYHPDLVIVSFCSIHLHRERQEQWWLVPPTTIIYNRPLFTRFLEAVPGSSRNPGLMALADVVAKSEAHHHMNHLHRMERVSEIAQNQLLLRSLLSVPNLLRPASEGTTAWGSACRYCRGKTARDVYRDAPYVLDDRALTLLEAIIDRARSGGTEIAIFWEPEATVQGTPPVRTPWTREGWETLDRAVHEVVERKNVLLLNCRDLLDQDDFLDSDRHWTVEGNAKIGAFIAEKLAPILHRLAERRR